MTCRSNHLTSRQRLPSKKTRSVLLTYIVRRFRLTSHQTRPPKTKRPLSRGDRPASRGDRPLSARADRPSSGRESANGRDRRGSSARPEAVPPLPTADPTPVDSARTTDSPAPPPTTAESSALTSAGSSLVPQSAISSRDRDHRDVSGSSVKSKGQSECG